MSGCSIERTFSALGGKVNIQAGGDGAGSAVTEAEAAIQDLHHRLTRFEIGSELGRLNADPRAEVPSSPIMIRFAEAVRYAGQLSNGLVDATLLDAIEDAGYAESIDPDSDRPDPTRLGTPPAVSRAPAGASPFADWDAVSVDHATGSVCRPVGVKLDSGGLGKGLAADVGAELLDHLDYFAVECCGDLRFGG